MKQLYIAIIILLSLSISAKTCYSESYAILFSGGGIPCGPEGSPYPITEQCSYWYDLVLTYEYLVEYAGYSHDNIYVFFGKGQDWNQTYTNDGRYNMDTQYGSDPTWPDNIVDYSNNPGEYPNGYDGILNQLNNVKDNFTSSDNILLWFPRGHGFGNSGEYEDRFSYAIYYRTSETTSSGWHLQETPSSATYTKPLYDYFSFKDNGSNIFKRLKIIVSSCYSGHVIAGNKTFLNHGGSSQEDDESILTMTSASWSNSAPRTSITCVNNNGTEEEEYHSQFTMALYSTLTGKNPCGDVLTFNTPPDQNGDGVISISELYDNILNCDLEVCQSTDAQLADPCPMADYLYIDEFLKLRGATLTLMQDEDKRYYRVDKILASEDETSSELVIPSNSDIEFVVDTEVHLAPGFRAERGCEFKARFGEIACP